MKRARKDPVAEALGGLLAQLPSPDSRRAYEADWARYVLWLELEGVGVVAARPRHVSAHVAHLRDKGMAKATISRALSVIREVYAALVRDELLAVNPAREVKGPKMDTQPRTPWFDEEQVAKLLNLPADTWRERRDRLCVQLLFGLGWRRREVAALRIEDFGENYLTVTGRLKGGKLYTVGVPEWLAAEVRAWVDANRVVWGGPLLPRKQAHPHVAISGDIVYQIVKAVCTKVGVPHASPHALRRSNITLGGKRGVDLKKRQLAVGHASQATTERYDRAREAAENAPGQVFADLIKPQEKGEKCEL